MQNKIKFPQNSKTVLTVIPILIGLLLVTSCSIFEDTEDYSISNFDQSVSAGLIDNIYSVMLDTVSLASFVTTDTEPVDLDVDSLITVDSDRQGIIYALEAFNDPLTPSEKKYFVITHSTYKYAYGILDLSLVTDTDNLVFYIDHFLTPTIWDYDGVEMKMTSDDIPLGVVAQSLYTHARYEYSLAGEKYIIRFARSEGLIEDGINVFHLVLLDDSALPSAEAAEICTQLNSSSGLNEITIPTVMNEVDTNWVGKTFASIYGEDSTRTQMAQLLESSNVVIAATELENIHKFTNESAIDLSDGYLLLDLTGNSANQEYLFYLDEYYDINIWSTTEDSAMIATGGGITYDEAGACTTIRQKTHFRLDAVKYIVHLSLLQTNAEINKIKLFIFEN